MDNTWNIKKNKEEIVKLCQENNITTIEQFIDVMLDSVRCECMYNPFEYLDGFCSDSEGHKIAYDKKEISDVLLKDPDKLTCRDISERMGGCAYVNNILYSIMKYLYEIGDN